MTDKIAQCARTFLHRGHDTLEGHCPGIEADDPWAVSPSYDVLIAGLKAIAADAEARGDHHTAAYTHSILAGEPLPPDEPSDAILEWQNVSPYLEGEGPGFGDDTDIEAGRCCPWCRGSLTKHNGTVWHAGYAVGTRHATDEPQDDDRALLITRVTALDEILTDAFPGTVSAIRLGVIHMVLSALGLTAPTAQGLVRDH